MTPEEILADLTINARHEGGIVFYECHWPKHWGWAYIMIDDRTGMIAITSDHGNWSFVWNPKHIGDPTLHHFIGGRMGVHYAIGKFMSRDAEVVDFDATKRDLVREVLGLRREGLMGRDVARARYDELVAWSEDDFRHCEAWAWPEWVTDPGECVRRCESGEARSFREIIWPVLRRCVQEELAWRASGTQPDEAIAERKRVHNTAIKIARAKLEVLAAELDDKARKTFVAHDGGTYRKSHDIDEQAVGVRLAIHRLLDLDVE